MKNPAPTRHVSPAGRPWSGEQPRGLAYWEGLSKIIQEEPVHERDRIMMGMLQPLGIEKGKPFIPTERQKRILIDAAQTGEVMARAIAYRKRFEGAKVWPGRNWELSLFLAETNQGARHHTQLDERMSWFYEAVGVSVGMMGRSVGAGQRLVQLLPPLRPDPDLLRPLLGAARHRGDRVVGNGHSDPGTTFTVRRADGF